MKEEDEKEEERSQMSSLLSALASPSFLLTSYLHWPGHDIKSKDCDDKTKRWQGEGGDR